MSISSSTDTEFETQDSEDQNTNENEVNTKGKYFKGIRNRNIFIIMVIVVALSFLSLNLFLSTFVIYKIYYSPLYDTKEYVFHSLNMNTGNQIFGSLYLKNNEEEQLDTISEMLVFDSNQKQEITLVDVDLIEPNGFGDKGFQYVCSGYYLKCLEGEDEYCRKSPEEDEIFGEYIIVEEGEFEDFVEGLRRYIVEQVDGEEDLDLINHKMNDPELIQSLQEQYYLEQQSYMMVDRNGRRAVQFFPWLMRLARYVPWRLILTRTGAVLGTVTAISIGAALEIYDRLVEDTYHLNRLDKEEAVQCVRLLEREKLEGEKELFEKYPSGFCLCDALCGYKGKKSRSGKLCEEIQIQYKEDNYGGINLQSCRKDGVRTMNRDCIYQGCKGLLPDPRPGCIYSPDESLHGIKLGDETWKANYKPED